MEEFFFSSRRRHTRYWRDWSSDVCSSDLAWGFSARAMVGHHRPLGKGVAAAAGSSAGDDCRTGEIGRASWRERVEISVVVVSLKKNNKKVPFIYHSCVSVFLDLLTNACAL